MAQPDGLGGFVMHKSSKSLRRGTERTPAQAPRILLLLRASVEGGVLNYRLAFSDGIQETHGKGMRGTNGERMHEPREERCSDTGLSNADGSSDKDMADDSCAGGSEPIWQGLPGTLEGPAGARTGGDGGVSGRKVEGTWMDVVRYHGTGPPSCS
jgi:hypothetical protein